MSNPVEDLIIEHLMKEKDPTKVIVSPDGKKAFVYSVEKVIVFEGPDFKSMSKEDIQAYFQNLFLTSFDF